ncbi:MAG: hypothetical protein JO263_03200 [Candidatus Eremiobacteraeota bacterium]|nr:hypothetical protein [Candidatus Eremiobacteraeota bacterium]
MEHRAFVFATLCLIAAGCVANQTVTPASTQPALSQSARRGGTSPTIALDTRSNGPTVAADIYGANLTVGYDFTQSYVNPSLQEAGIHLARFPGGSLSDVYHWENGGTLCPHKGSHIAPNATFDNYITRVAGPLQLDVEVTLNYGSNQDCNGGGDPNEAAAWAAYALKHGYHVSHWTVGNEVYGSWEYDLHAKPHDPTTYSNAVRTGYYPAMKKADPNAKVGVVVDNPLDKAWNTVVLKDAQPFDFVELHFYPEYQRESDSQLLGQDVADLANELANLRAQMTAAGVPQSVPIYLGEYNNTAGQEGKQSVSIVNGLFLGQVIGTLANAGVPMATWWLAYGGCGEQGDFSKQLYGWQIFGSEGLVSPGIPQTGCNNAPTVPAGTPFPTARVMGLFSADVPGGSQVRTTNVPSKLGSSVRAYGFAEGGGYAFVVFNNTLSSINVQAQLQHASRSKFTAALDTYGRTQYDASKQNQWVGPTHQSLGTVGTTMPLTLPAYGVSLLLLK